MGGVSSFSASGGVPVKAASWERVKLRGGSGVSYSRGEEGGGREGKGSEGAMVTI